MIYKLLSNNKYETKKIAAVLSRSLRAGDIVTLSGDLGAGKTTFVSGLAKSLGIKEKVISPTFNILKCYFDAKIPLYHIDAYRLENQNINIGLEEYIEGDGICVIEWPIFIKPLLNAKHLDVKIINKSGNKREIIFATNDEHYNQIIKELKNAKISVA